MKWTGILMGLLLAVLSFSAQAKKCTYEFSGYVRIKHHDEFSQVADDSRPANLTSKLKNVKVRISGRAKVGFGWGWWKKWKDVRTSQNGYFKYKTRKKCHKRRFKIQVKFDHPRLEVRHAKATSGSNKVKWYMAYEETSGHSGRSDYDEHFDFVLGQSGYDLRKREPHYHAEIWKIYWDAIDFFDGLSDNRLKFHDQIKVKYPHNKNNLDSYANPLNNVIYLVRKSSSDDDGKDLGTIVHELMHIWAYQHSRLENRMAYYLISHMKEGTHGHVDKTFVAFHEGFAEFAKDMLTKELYGAPHDRPFSPFGLDDVFNLDHWSEMEFHDFGWWNTFSMLTFGNLWEFNFDTEDNFLSRNLSGSPIGWINCSSPAPLTFVDTLQVFERRGRNDIHAREMNWNDFIREIERQNNGVDRSDRQSLRTVLDPQVKDGEVNEAFCDRFIPTPIPRPIPRQPSIN